MISSPRSCHMIDFALKSPLGAFQKRLTVTLRRGVFVRLMNQRCFQQPNRCCSPPVSREMPTVSCTGHLAPWCLSLFIVRGFPITRAGRGHFLSTLSTEKCLHNAWCCHGGQSSPCSEWYLDSWSKAPEKEWEIDYLERESVWTQTFEQGLWVVHVILIYSAHKAERFYIIALCGLGERQWSV